jgi:hypothetical protein
LRRDRLVQLTGIAVIVLVITATVEVAAFFYTTYLARQYGILFYVPQVTEAYATYAARVNPVLGWPSPQALEKEQADLLKAAALSGAAPGKADGGFAISAYGDSFTAGYGVEPSQTWSTVLGRRLGCAIANYGVPGYGTDQAYLRFHQNSQDTADIVILGVLSENIQRNINQFRNFLLPSNQCQTKPRFLLDSQGRLQLVPLPQLSAGNYKDFIRNPDHYLNHDYFVPGGPSGAQKLGFPYTWSILKAHKFFYDRYVRGYKSYLQFYQPHHPSQALPLTVAIIRQFVSEAQKAGKHPLVLIFPTDEDFRVYNQSGHFVYEPLIQALTRDHIEYVDLGPELLQGLGKSDYMVLFQGGQYHHFNEEGNRRVAEILGNYFKDRNYLPRTVPPSPPKSEGR